MPDYTIFRRTQGFSGDNSFVGRLLAVSGSTLSYDKSRAYTKVGEGEFDLTGETQWITPGNEASVISSLSSKQPINMADSAIRTAQVESAQMKSADTSGGFFSNLFKGGIGGTIDFGVKRTWLPFAIVITADIILAGGFAFAFKSDK